MRNRRLFWWVVPQRTSSIGHRTGSSCCPNSCGKSRHRVWFLTGYRCDEANAVFDATLRQTCGRAGGEAPISVLRLDPSLKWMIIENHHEVLIAAGEPAVQQMERVKASAERDTH